jgi:hypothetical protein
MSVKKHFFGEMFYSATEEQEEDYPPQISTKPIPAHDALQTHSPQSPISSVSSESTSPPTHNGLLNSFTGSLSRIPKWNPGRKGSAPNLKSNSPRPEKKKGILSGILSSDLDLDQNFLESQLLDTPSELLTSHIDPRELLIPKVDDVFKYDESSIPEPGQEKLLLKRARLLVNGEKPRELEFGKVPEHKLRAKDLYTVEFQFVIREECGDNLMLHEKISTVTTSDFRLYGMGSLVKRDEKYIYRLPVKEAMDKKYSKVEVQIRFLDEEKKVLNG